MNLTEAVEGIVEIVRANRDALTTVLTNRSLVLKELAAGRIFTIPEEHWNSRVFFISGFVHFREKKDGVCSLYEIAVYPWFRGQGFGKILVEMLQERETIIRLKCSVRNKIAQKLWKDCGFKEVGIETKWNRRKGRESTYKVLEWGRKNGNV